MGSLQDFPLISVFWTTFNYSVLDRKGALKIIIVKKKVKIAAIPGNSPQLSGTVLVTCIRKQRTTA